MVTARKSKLLVTSATIMFIAAFEDFNYDSQLSYNQPEMMIKYKE